jgi:hypothetical protein
MKRYEKEEDEGMQVKTTVRDQYNTSDEKVSINENVWSSCDRNDLFRANKRTDIILNRLNRQENNSV